MRDVAHRKALKSNSVSDWSSYRTLRNKVNSMLRSAKSLYFNKLSSSLRSNPGKFWRHFQSSSGRSKPVCNIQFSVTADILNMHFLTIPYTTTANVTSTVPATDGFSPRLLKASPYMMRLITILVNKCIAT